MCFMNKVVSGGGRVLCPGEVMDPTAQASRFHTALFCVFPVKVLSVKLACPLPFLLQLDAR